MKKTLFSSICFCIAFTLASCNNNGDIPASERGTSDSAGIGSERGLRPPAGDSTQQRPHTDSSQTQKR